MAAAIITASVTVIVAALVFLLNQYAQLRAEQRQSHLARVNSQLRELYGPLYALIDVNEQIWQALRSGGLPEKNERSRDTLATEWRKWLDGALMPANIKMRDLIVANGDLILEESFPEPLRKFCAHVGCCEALLSRTVQSGIADQVYISHPGAEYVDYIRSSFALLKSEQQRLLGAEGASLR
jgi:hypothetical protein